MSNIELSVWVSITGVVASSLISIFIALRLGPSHVEKMKQKREHSQKFLEDGLKPWLNEMHMLCHLGAEYTRTDKKMMPLYPDDPTQMLFVDLKAHLSTGHPEVLKEWENYKKAVLENNQKWADLFNELTTRIETSAKLPTYHLYMHEKKPQFFIVSVNIVATIASSIRYEIQNGQPWGDRINYNRTSEGNFSYISVNCSAGEIGHIQSQEDFYPIQKLIETIISEIPVRNRIAEFARVENEELPKKKALIEEKLKELMRSIQLGNNLKGKCKYC